VRTVIEKRFHHISELKKKEEKPGKSSRNGRIPDHRGELQYTYVEGERIVKEEFRDVVVDLCELLHQLGRFWGG
jgi:hypothetical protein